MRSFLKQNKYLRSLYKLSRGFTPVYIEYAINFRPRWTEGEGNPHLAKIISRPEETYRKNLEAMAAYLPIVEKIQSGHFPFVIDWHNHHTPALDGLAIMWAALQAKSTFMEIGSGTSTLFAKAALLHEQRGTRIVSIDPKPRVEVDAVCDQLHRERLEDVDLVLFDALQSGDTLFVDNSHRSFMNSDVTTFMLDVLPRLKPGVLIGVHDIFLPYDYYESWIDRAYNEQYLLGSYLLSNPDYFDIQLANHWISRRQLHFSPLEKIWGRFESRVRDRLSSAFWGIKR